MRGDLGTQAFDVWQGKDLQPHPLEANDPIDGLGIFDK
jgi:hypothetical protein